MSPRSLALMAAYGLVAFAVPDMENLGEVEGPHADRHLAPGQHADPQTLRSAPDDTSAQHAREQAPQPGEAVKAQGLPEMVRIIVEETENMPPTGWPVSLNGYAYIIRPNEEVDVPVGVLEILQNAKITKPIRDPNNGQKIIGWRDQLRIPFRRV